MKNYIFLVLFCTGIVNASYVGVLVQINNIVEPNRKIPGVGENDVRAHVVIPYYIEILNKYIETQSDQAKLKYAKTKEILKTYESYGTDSDNYKIEERKDGISFINCDRTKVDWFLKQIFNTFEGMWYPSESPVFSMLYYVHHYHTIKDQYDTLKKEIDHFAPQNTRLTLENSRLTLENNKLETIIIELRQQSVSQLDWLKERDTVKKEYLELNREYEKYKNEQSEQMNKITEVHLESLKEIKELSETNDSKMRKKLDDISQDVSKNNQTVTRYRLIIFLLFISNAYFGYAYYTR